MGIDIVMHTLTKYIGGHSDLIGGVMVCNNEALLEKITMLRDLMGNILSPMSAWLAIRGLRTLEVRLNKH